MLTIMENVLFIKDLLRIMKNYNSQTASELFNGYNGIPTNIIDEDYEFHVIACSKEDLEVILTFFTKFSLIGNQTIILKSLNISNDDFKYLLEKFENSNIINRFIFDVAYDKSCDFVDSSIFEIMERKISKIKKAIPKDATNLEIITYVYNWLKKREYNYDEDNPMIAKTYSLSLVTGETVCVGFSKIFNNILAEYNIKASEYKYCFRNDNNEICGHDISIVNVEDDKYGVNGLYFFDLTKDCYSPSNENNYKYSGFMMTYDEIKKDNFVDDMLGKMLSMDVSDLNDTIDLIKPEIDKLTEDDDIFDEKNINENIKEIIFNLMQLDTDLFRVPTVDLGYLSNEYGALYYIYNYILFLKNNLGTKVNEETFIDLLINTVDVNKPGYYLVSAISYLSNDDSNSFVPENHLQYIKNRLEKNHN